MTAPETLVELAGRPIDCARCGGTGMTQIWANEYDECRDCGGSGKNWRYPGGALARYYSGPLLGRETTALRAQAKDSK